MIRADQALVSLSSTSPVLPQLTGADREAASRYRYSRAASICGGAEQIQKNIVAQRILSLPALNGALRI